MFPEMDDQKDFWIFDKAGRNDGSAPPAVDEQSLGVARAVAAMNGGGLMNSYRRGDG